MYLQIWNYLGNLAVTYLSAVVLTVLVETPLLDCEHILLKGWTAAPVGISSCLGYMNWWSSCYTNLQWLVLLSRKSKCHFDVRYFYRWMQPLGQTAQFSPQWCKATALTLPVTVSALWDYPCIPGTCLWFHTETEHYIDVIMGAMAAQITGLSAVTQLFVQTKMKENIKAPRHWPLWGEFTGDQWIPRTKRASDAENVSISCTSHEMSSKSKPHRRRSFERCHSNIPSHSQRWRGSRKHRPFCACVLLLFFVTCIINHVHLTGLVIKAISLSHSIASTGRWNDYIISNLLSGSLNQMWFLQARMEWYFSCRYFNFLDGQHH